MVVHHSRQPFLKGQWGYNVFISRTVRTPGFPYRVDLAGEFPPGLPSKNPPTVIVVERDRCPACQNQDDWVADLDTGASECPCGHAWNNYDQYRTHHSNQVALSGFSMIQEAATVVTAEGIPYARTTSPVGVRDERTQPPRVTDRNNVSIRRAVSNTPGKPGNPGTPGTPGIPSGSNGSKNNRKRRNKKKSQHQQQTQATVHQSQHARNNGGVAGTGGSDSNSHVNNVRPSFVPRGQANPFRTENQATAANRNTGQQQNRHQRRKPKHGAPSGT